MATWRKKVLKEEPDQLEQAVAQAMLDLEKADGGQQKAELRDLVFISASEVDVAAGKKAIVIVVPYILLNNFRKLHHILTMNLEKKFSGKHVIFIGQRRILPKESRNNKRKRQQRPRSRTLTAVHEALLEDIAYPTEIVGKRLRVRTDNSRLLKVHLNPKEKQNAEGKVESFAAVYKKLTGKSVVFTFPAKDQYVGF
mmetsp:Transcript_27971/g.78234  ORF Transcript_27971/g.78234 Transcript_27971/m.78234 type:complete len:197 (-) Transcript_27971:64-654(-)|eukprot:CAMPEP_0119119778 /NCGR_PEP_ID=MMETSP1310-20130426/1113_1 /TAXON_ID=464262 /ORGANISM="Genus nov. species nov., Strain RCC2339" /LENGTH=196 /DNA_ID=CAMNT_0007109225 /DNA_START=75 /DNA_END=665 /DNA_ORIENTATION=+